MRKLYIFEKINLEPELMKIFRQAIYRAAHKL
jgi:hypothetical protein